MAKRGMPRWSNKGRKKKGKRAEIVCGVVKGSMQTASKWKNVHRSDERKTNQRKDLKVSREHFSQGKLQKEDNGKVRSLATFSGCK